MKYYKIPKKRNLITKINYLLRNNINKMCYFTFHVLGGGGSGLRLPSFFL